MLNILRITVFSCATDCILAGICFCYVEGVNIGKSGGTMSSFRLKLIIIMVIAVGIVVISLVSFSEIMLERFLREKALDSQRYSVHAVLRAVTDFTRYHAAAISFSAQQTEMRNTAGFDQRQDEFRGLAEQARPELRRSLRETLRAHPEFSYLNIYTPDKAQPILGEPFSWQKGTPLASYLQGFSHRDWYKGVIATSAVYVSEVYATAQGPLVVAIAAPVFDMDGPKRKLVAIHGGILRLDTLDKFLQSISLGQTGFSYIIDRKGAIVAYGGKSTMRGQQRELDQALIQLVLQESDEQIHSKVLDYPLNANRRFVSYARLASPDWVVVSQQSEQEALAGLTLKRKIGLAALILIGLSCFAIPLIVRILTRPLSQIMQHLRNITGRDFTQQLPAAILSQQDEFGNLARVISDMQRSRCKMEADLQEQLQLAARIQAGFLPEDFSHPLLSVRTIHSPFHLVSGDYFDYVWSEDRKLLSGFLLDVSGHGVASSLQGVAVNAYFRHSLSSRDSLPARLQWINQNVLHYFTDETYAAALYFEFDLTHQRLSFATAGIYLFLSASCELPVCIKKPGSLIGISESPEFQEYSVAVHPGDNFYFMSDGIYEQLTDVDDLPVDSFEDMLHKLRQIATYPERRDDCSALCIRLQPPKQRISQEGSEPYDESS
jgi:serine phosphatase RsbU (regulator of sigma subunit)